MGKLIGIIENGPLAGLEVSGLAAWYTIGGMGIDPRRGPHALPCPLGYLNWTGRSWRWSDREPEPGIERDTHDPELQKMHRQFARTLEERKRLT